MVSFNTVCSEEFVKLILFDVIMRWYCSLNKIIIELELFIFFICLSCSLFVPSVKIWQIEVCSLILFCVEDDYSFCQILHDV